MAKYVIMPKLGFNMREGKIVKWLKHEGERVQEQEAILQIETDKSVIDVESQISGFLRKILVEEGEVIPVTLPIGIIAEKDEDIDEMVHEALKKLGSIGKEDNLQKEVEGERTLEENIPLKEVETDQVESQVKKISPRARKKAKELGLDLQLIKNKFSNKMILAEDIIEFSKKEKMSEAHEVTQKAQDERKVIAKEEPYSGMRKMIGDRLSQSKFSAPHIYFTTSVDMTNILTFSEMIKKDKESHISINDLIIYVTVKALRENPKLNVSLLNERIVYYSRINIGIAVGLEDGLIVPVLKEAEKKNLLEISTESKTLIHLAREKKLLPGDYQDGTFTISNLGMFDIEQFTAVINPPESAILAVGSIQKKPFVDENNDIIIKPIMKMTLSVDHRVIDGIAAALFLKKIKEYLSNPGLLMLQ